MSEATIARQGLTQMECSIIKAFYSSGLGGTGRPRRGTEMAKTAYDLGREDARFGGPDRDEDDVICTVLSEIERH